MSELFVGMSPNIWRFIPAFNRRGYFHRKVMNSFRGLTEGGGIGRVPGCQQFQIRKKTMGGAT